MVSILFFIKRKKLLKDGNAPIYIRITAQKTSVEFAAGKSVNPNQWIAVKGRAKGNTLQNKQLNAYLDQQEYALHDFALQIEKSGKQVSAKEISNRYKARNAPRQMFLALYEEHNKELSQLVGKTVAKATYKRHETSLKLFREYLWYTHHVKDIAVADIDLEMLQKYQHYLMTVRKNNNNTTVKYLRNMGKVLHLAVSRKIIQSSPLDEMSLKIDAVDKDFLSANELDKLTKMQFSVRRLEQVRDIFTFCCYTGLAYVDVYSLTEDDLVNGEGGMVWIKKARHKTNVMCHIPLLKPAIDILSKYAPFRTDKRLLPVMSNQKMNAYLKEIADLAGITKQLTTHCARHTFATTVTLANNVSIENVSKMLGHSSIRMTQHYARILDESIARDMKKVAECYE